MSTPIVTWYANGHEHSLHYFKFGLMQLARAGDIRFHEIENARAPTDDLPERVRRHIHCRTVAVRIRDGRLSRLLFLDGQDSIFQLSPLLEVCDLYLSCSYHHRFFAGEPFALQLPWQSDADVAWYRNEYARLQRCYGPHLRKARAFAPIGPAMEWTQRLPLLRRKIHGLRHRLSQFRRPSIDWVPQFERFGLRWSRLQLLKCSAIRHDIVLKDTLWGWPEHRMALHRRLSSLGNAYDIRSELHHAPATEHIEAVSYPPPEDFPLVCGGGISGDYEEMLAASRLGVFATGFHWGCRNIVTLAWLLGVKVLSDPFIYESWFDFAELGTEFTRDGQWLEVEDLLGRFSRADAVAARPQIQKVFDQWLGPAVCARKILEMALAPAS